MNMLNHCHKCFITAKRQVLNFCKHEQGNDNAINDLWNFLGVACNSMLGSMINNLSVTHLAALLAHSNSHSFCLSLALETNLLYLAAFQWKPTINRIMSHGRRISTILSGFGPFFIFK